MAMTLDVFAQARVSNTTAGGFVFAIPTVTFSPVTLAGTGFKAGLQSVGTSEENLDYGDVSTANAGWLFMRNIDTTNYVDWGMSDSGTMKAVARLKPGEPWQCIRIQPSAQVRLQANTAACLVEYYLLQT